MEPNPDPQNDAGATTNGEISVSSLDSLLTLALSFLASTSPPACPPAFLDIGSGRGRALLSAALVHPTSFSSVHGIEIDPLLHELASTSLASFQKHEHTSHTPPATFTKSDFRFVPLPDIPTLVYCCCTAFPPALFSQLAEYLSRLPPATVIVTLTYQLPSNDFELLSTTTVSTDWSESVMAYIHAVRPRCITLFYLYTPIPDTASFAAAQTALTTSLSLSGRIRLANEGINGHLCGPPSAIAAYQAALPYDLPYKLASSPADPFQGEMLVRVCDEITAAGPLMKKSLPEALGGAGGTHLKPAAFHAAIKDLGEPAPRPKVLIDTRNCYETAVGMFKGAIDPHIRTFAQFPGWVESNKDRLKDADVYMYCTGGIRCEKASSYLNGLGLANTVSQLEGGIHSYLAEFSAEAQSAGVSNSAAAASPVSPPIDASLWQGVNYTFDARLSARSAGASGHCPSSKCCSCGKAWESLSADVVCRVCKNQILICDGCRGGRGACSPLDEGLVAKFGVNYAKRVAAEAASEYLCTEHQLLGDGWRAFLEGAEQRGVSRSKLRGILRQLEVQKDSSKGRGGQSRRKTLRKEIERLAEYLAEEDGEGGEEGGGEGKFAAFFPLLSLWS